MRASAAQAAAKLAPTLTLNVISNEAKDPICGITVEKSKAKQNINRNSRERHFTSAAPDAKRNLSNRQSDIWLDNFAQTRRLSGSSPLAH